MAPAKKKTAKKKAVKKPVSKTAKKAVKKAVNKAVNKKAVSKKVAKKSKSNGTKIKVTLEQRHKMICEAAYYISLDKTYETVNPTEDWLDAEEFINQICTVHSQ